MCTKVEFNYLGAYKRMNVSVRQKNEIDKERLGILAEHISPSEIKLVIWMCRSLSLSLSLSISL
jgi:hypothetical protein